MTKSGFKKWALILALLFILHIMPLRAQSVTGTNFGISTTASGPDSMAFGYFTSAIGPNSTAFGNWTTALLQGTMAFGFQTTASGCYSTAFGGWTSASGNYSIAYGVDTSASGYCASSTGVATNASAYAEFVVGQFNIARTTNSFYWVPTDPIFVVGNGQLTGSGQSDALVVYKNGNAVVSGTLSISGSNPVLVQPAGDLSMGSFHSGAQPQQ